MTVSAIQDGSWNDPATWEGGHIPGTGDVVELNGHTITDDVASIACSSVTNANGGQLLIDLSVGDLAIYANLMADVIPLALVTGSVHTLTVSTVRGGTVQGAHGLINNGTGNIAATTSTGGSPTESDYWGDGCHGIINNSTGLITVGDAIGGDGIEWCHGVLNNSTGAVAATNAVGGDSGYSNDSYGICNLGGGPVTAANSTGGNGYACFGLYNLQLAVVNVTNANGGPSTYSIGVYDAGNGLLTVKNVAGGLYDSAFGIKCGGNAANCVVTGNLIYKNEVPIQGHFTYTPDPGAFIQFGDSLKFIQQP